MTPFDLLVLGDCNADVVVQVADPTPVFGQAERLVDAVTLTMGGSGAITACAAARLGLRTALVSLLGKDPLGDYLHRALAERAVDVQGVRRTADYPTGCTVVLAAPGDRAMLTAPGTVAHLDATMVAPDLLAAARHVHVSSYFLQTALRPGLPDLLQQVRRRGGTTSIDPNWDPSGEWDAGLLELLPLVDVLLPNAEEARQLARRADVWMAAASLARRVGALAVKCGANGALAAVGDELVGVDAPPVSPVDAIGAGDTFDAGWIAGLVRGWPLERRLRFAAACGALATRAVGGVAAQPTAPEAAAAAGLAEAGGRESQDPPKRRQVS